MGRLRTTTIGLLAVLVTLLTPALASARRSTEYAYSFEQVWSATIRMLRVDYGFPIRDRDRDIGYLVFDYVDGGRSVPASAEVVHVRVDGRDQIRVVIQVPAMPSYVEVMLLDRLRRKLLDDFGEPLPPRAGGDDGARDDGDDGDEDRDGDAERDEDADRSRQRSRDRS